MSPYNPNFDIDKEYGEDGEETVRRFLGLSPEQIEVKRKRRLDDVFYVEVAQSPGATGFYKASGINTTKSSYTIYVVGDTGVIVGVPTPRLKGAAHGSNRKAEEKDGSNPTKGRLVTFMDILRGRGEEKRAA